MGRIKGRDLPVDAELEMSLFAKAKASPQGLDGKAQRDAQACLLIALEALTELAGGDMKVVRIFINSMLTCNANDLELLRKYLTTRDRQAIARLCHKMAGAACVFRYEPLIRSCKQLKEVSIDGSWPLLLKKAQVLEQVILKLQELCSVVMQDNKLALINKVKGG